MKSMPALLLLLAAGVAAQAQARATLTVIASEGPAQVILSGRLLGVANPRFIGAIAPGRYELIVRKSGLPEFRQNIVLGSQGLLINAQLGGHPAPQPLPQPQVMTKPLFNLSISANAPGAQVSVNGAPVGPAPARAMLEDGNYQVSINAPGFEPYSAVVTVHGNTSHSANLRQMLQSRLTVTANLSGAEVFLNNVKAGNTPLTVDLVPGSYNLRVSAPGYQDYAAGIVMNGSQTVSASLIPQFATVTVFLPPQFINHDNNRDQRAQLDLYIDGIKQNGVQAQVPAGQRRIRVVAGFLSFETSVIFEAGRSYTVEPVLSLNVR
jgi:hypothetical protein